MRAIDADILYKLKFHPLPYTQVIPSDTDAESYKRGWNDAIDAIIENSPTIEPELCNDDKGCSNCMYSGRPTYKSPCSECHDNSQWEMKPISRSHENGTECEDAVSREQVLKLFSTHDGKYLYKAIQMLPSVTLKPDHSGDTTEMVEYDDCISRQAVADVAYEVGNLFDGEDDTRTPYGVAFDIQMAVDKLPSVTSKPKPCEDAVSRKEVLNLFAHNCDHVRPYMDTWEAVKRLTPVTPKRNTGKWIVHYECPKCGEITKDFTEYCPFCNADMRGSQNEPNKQTD